jgi:hypothetical protein
MKTTTISISSILFAVAVLASGCHKAEPTDTNSMGPAQAAGKAVDDAGANAASASREAAADANAAANRAGEKIDAATDRAGERSTQPPTAPPTTCAKPAPKCARIRKKPQRT